MNELKSHFKFATFKKQVMILTKRGYASMRNYLLTDVDEGDGTIDTFVHEDSVVYCDPGNDEVFNVDDFLAEDEPIPVKIIYSLSLLRL